MHSILMLGAVTSDMCGAPIGVTVVTYLYSLSLQNMYRCLTFLWVHIYIVLLCLECSSCISDHPDGRTSESVKETPGNLCFADIIAMY